MSNYVRHNIEEAKEAAKKRGGLCLSGEYEQIKAKLKFVCAEGHKFQTSLECILRGRWCPTCGGSERKSLGDAVKLAEIKNGKCLSNEYINARTKLKWQCERGHVFDASYGNVKFGKWCPFCARNIKYTIAQVHHTIEALGGRCLEKEYINNGTPMKVMCAEGYIWSVCYNNILNGQWCPFCAKNSPNTIEDAQDMAKKHSGCCLSKSYKNVKIKMAWRCKVGHNFKMNYNSVQQGKWCPRCKTVSRPQRELQKILCKLLKQKKVKTNYRPNWMKNKKTSNNLEIDIYFPDLKLAVEYHGRQHYVEVQYSKKMTKSVTKNALKQRKYRDRLKKKLIKQNKDKIEHFIIFTYRNTIEEENVRKILIRRGLLCL